MSGTSTRTVDNRERESESWNHDEQLICGKRLSTHCGCILGSYFQQDFTEGRLALLVKSGKQVSLDAT